MSDESQFAKGYKYGTYVTKNYDSLLDKMFFTKDLEEFAVKNLKQKIPFTSDERLSAGYDKGVADMNLALQNKPREGERMTAQQLMAILQNRRPSGNVGNVSNNEAAMFSGNPMNGAVAGGNVGNVSDREASFFNMMAEGGVSNPMPRINEMRNNLATAGSVGNISDKEAAMFMAGNSGEMTDAAMAKARQELNFLKAMGQNRILDDDEKARLLYLQDLTAPVELLPVDIDGASAGNPLSKQQLNNILERIYQMRGVK